MNYPAIYHRPESEMAYLLDSETIQIQLKAAKNDLKQVQILADDPYALNNPHFKRPHPQTMTKIMTDELYDYWQINLQSTTKRLAYLFMLEDQTGNRQIYSEAGFAPASDVTIRSEMNNYFRMPYFQEIDAFHAPTWVKQTVWYQIFPERFANGDPTNDPQDTKAWNPRIHPGRQDFYGGDLQGVLDHLDYLVELGVNGIYFNPLFLSPSNHKYDTQDYFQIDPHFGDAKLFKKLVQTAHQKGIKIMLDAVFNHIGDQSPQWQDVIQKGAASPYADWFHIHKFPVSYTVTDDFEFSQDANYDTFAFTPHMPKLNTANPAVQDYLLKIAKYWVQEFDIDAWRLDVANEVDHHFWRRFHQEMLALKPDFYILGEIWHTSQAWLNGDELTGVMNYPYTGAIIDHFIKAQLTAPKLLAKLTSHLMKYRDSANQTMFNALDSHDTARLLTLAKEDKTLALQTLAFTFLQPGVPSIYYGTEYAMIGANDPDCRKPMNWQPNESEQNFYQNVQNLVNLRRKHWQILSEGAIIFQIQADLIVVKRECHGQSLTGIFNTTKQVQSVPTTTPILLQAGYQKNKLAPKGFIILVD